MCFKCGKLKHCEYKMDSMIDKMLEDDLRMIRDNNNADDWILFILRDGFVGYHNQTDEEITQEYKERFETE